MSIDDWRVERKVELRRHFCDLREILAGEDLVSASTAICRRLASWTLLQAARTVLTYLAFRNEIDLSPLFRILPHICWAVPRVEGMAMTIHPYDPTRLVRHRFGMLEPEPALPEIAPGEIDVVLVSGRVEDIAFRAYGCAAAIASCSALTEMVKGTTLAYALAVTPETLSKALGGLPLRREYCPHVAVSALRNAIRNASHYMRSLAPP